MLEIRSLKVRYGGVVALDNVSMQFPTGKITSIIGSNGAGKTSLLNAIVSLVKYAGGDVSFNGVKLTGCSTAQIARSGIALVPEGRRIFTRMSVRDNLLTGAHILSDQNRVTANIDRVVSYFPILAKRSNQMAGSLSGGEQQMLALGRSLMSDPKMLLLDEPSTGLAPKVEQDVMATIVRLSSEAGVGVVLVEQNANLALKHSNWAYVLDTGRIALEGPALELVGDRRVQEAYLGV